VTEYRSWIAAAAKAQSLDPQLVEAVAITESSGRTDAFRFEPAFYRRYLKDNAAYVGQIPRRISSSYGLMQVMYSTARELGFGGEPELLFLPDVGLEGGCRKLAAELTWAHGDVRNALAAYNGGRGNYRADLPQKYADKVLRALESLKLEDPR